MLRTFSNLQTMHAGFLSRAEKRILMKKNKTQEKYSFVNNDDEFSIFYQNKK